MLPSDFSLSFSEEYPDILSCALLTPDEMGHADQLTIDAGTDSFQLMCQAGRAATQVILDKTAPTEKIVCLAGPGNNGGDAFCIAHDLVQKNRAVTVVTLQAPADYRGAAAKAVERFGRAPMVWDGRDFAQLDQLLDQADWIIDGLFGAGLSRDLEGAYKSLVQRVNAAERKVIAIDLPTGIDGASGQVRGDAIKADFTVTFFRKKPGHCLVPGRRYCGTAVRVCDIGIAEQVLQDIRPSLFENGPSLWRKNYQVPDEISHKYSRGHVSVFSGGPLQTGASRMSALGALRAGAGLVTLLGEEEALKVHAAHVTSIMLQRLDDMPLSEWVQKRKVRALVTGPALGLKDKEAALLQQVLQAVQDNDSCAVVLDADALTLLSQHHDLQVLVKGLKSPAILTPHDGEFQRLFPDISKGNRWEKAQKAARSLNSVIICKGADTVIAAPDGRCAIQGFASPWLSTGGTGDVLAGVAGAMLANGMPAFEAASMAVWLHAKASDNAGLAFAGEDLPDYLGQALGEALT
jgi:hydroxyethylthiazole kinase-like uncharacterized protein yjeF